MPYTITHLSSTAVGTIPMGIRVEVTPDIQRELADANRQGGSAITSVEAQFLGALQHHGLSVAQGKEFQLADHQYVIADEVEEDDDGKEILSGNIYLWTEPHHITRHLGQFGEAVLQWYGFR